MKAAEDGSTAPLLHTMEGGSKLLNCHRSTIKRAVSHGKVKVIYIGDRPMIPNDELLRVARDGLDIPPGYKRKTVGLPKGGRKRRGST